MCFYHSFYMIFVSRDFFYNIVHLFCFLGTSQEIGCEDNMLNDLCYFEWGAAFN